MANVYSCDIWVTNINTIYKQKKDISYKWQVA